MVESEMYRGGGGGGEEQNAPHHRQVGGASAGSAGSAQPARQTLFFYLHCPPLSNSRDQLTALTVNSLVSLLFCLLLHKGKQISHTISV